MFPLILDVSSRATDSAMGKVNMSRELLGDPVQCSVTVLYFACLK